MKAALNRLRVLRAERRMSQMDAADRARLSLNRYWRIENSYVEPTPEERIALASVFGVAPRDVFPVQQACA
jgi:transcriptional regulator with XRE-family HTH domain